MRSHSHIAIGLVVGFLASLSLAVERQRTVDIFAWPLSASTSSLLAKVSYNSSAATLDSYKSFSPSRYDEVVRVGFHHASSGSWSGISTSASNFANGKDRTLQLHVNTDGELYHVGFKASAVSGSHGKTKDSKKGDLTVEVVPVKKGPAPQLNKPVVVNPDGSLPEKVEEKSFFQK